MPNDYTISIHLDTRREKANGKYPVKLRVYQSATSKRKYYGTIFDFTKSEFESIWVSKKPRKKHKTIRRQLFELESKAVNVAESLTPFTFDQFEKKLYRKEGDGIRVSFQYQTSIDYFLRNKQIGTANSYQLAEKSFKRFIEQEKLPGYSKLTFYDITPEWLKKYEDFMVQVNDRSYTTVSIYLRTLRAIFNKAIDEKEIERDYYPFGKRKYQIPSSNNVKKALNKEELHRLFNSEPETPEQQKAKDFWFFSYSCNGMNMKDIALLKYRDIQNDKIEFYRSKTITTSKAQLKPITAYLTSFAHEIIKKYGNQNKSPNQLVFDIIKESQSPEQKQRDVKKFTRFVNQHMKKLSAANDLPSNISTYWARHSFATNFVLNGASLVDAMESLGHKNIQTTQNYLRSFDSDTKREMANSLMNFE